MEFIQVKEVNINNGLNVKTPIKFDYGNTLEITLANGDVIEIELFGRYTDDKIQISAKSKGSWSGRPVILPVASNVIEIGVSM